MDEQRRGIGVQVIAGLVLGSNLVMLFWLMDPGLFNQNPARMLIPLLSTTASYPLDFYRTYFSSDSLPQIGWIMIMMVSAAHLVRYHRLARVSFILLNIIHMMILGTSTFLAVGSGRVMSQVFILYFTYVVSGTYIGYLTLSEIRQQFQAGPDVVGAVVRRVRIPFVKRRITRRNIRSMTNLALAYMNLDRLQDAQDLFRRLVETHPGHAGSHFHLGWVRFRLKQYHEAIDSFREALRLDPIHFQAAFYLGRAYRQIGCDREAMAALTRASHIRPDDEEVLYHLGRAHRALGHCEEARECFRKSLNLVPGDGRCYYELGSLSLDHDLGDQEAFESLRTAARLMPDSVAVHLKFAAAAGKLKRFKDAVRALKEAVRLDAQNAQAHYQLGVHYLLLKDYDSAHREYRILKPLDEDLARELLLLIQ